MSTERSLRLPDGRVFAYREHGDPGGKPCFFLHGFPGSRLEAEPAHEPALRAGVRVIAPDRPGIGRSSPRPGYTILDVAADLRDAADRLGLDGFSVAGVSGGGPFALGAAVVHADRVTATVLVACPAPPDLLDMTQGLTFRQRAELELGRRGPRAAGALLGVLAKVAGRRPERWLRMVERGLPEPDRRLFRQPEVRALIVADYIEAFRQGSAAVSREVDLLLHPWGFPLDRIATPVFLHHGRLDTTVPVEAGRVLAAAIPGCRATFHPGEGHFSLPWNRLEEVFGAAAEAARP